MHLAEFGMLVAVIGTLLHHEIVRYDWIIVGLVIGSLVGLAMGVWVPMTAMPQRTALSHAFGALAASLVGIAEYHHHGAALGHFKMSAVGLEVFLGSLTTTGSLVAFAKLQGLMPGTPMTFKGQNIFNLTLITAVIACFVALIFVPAWSTLFWVMLGLSFAFGILLVLPIGTRGHAGRHVVAEQLCRPRQRGHRLRHRQQSPHHRRHARWLQRLHPLASSCARP